MHRACSTARPPTAAQRAAHQRACARADCFDTPPPPGPAAAWATGLATAKERYEWLTDCYRMRCDDDYALGGCYLHGLYSAATGGGGSDEIARDFLVFCRLARLAGALPERWDWPAYLRHAAPMLRFAFEKSDAQDKYGSENVFRAALGGRSLRATAEAIYGSSCLAQARMTARHEAMIEAIAGLDDDAMWYRNFGEDEGLDPFRHAGGRDAWRALHETVALSGPLRA